MKQKVNENGLNLEREGERERERERRLSCRLIGEEPFSNCSQHMSYNEHFQMPKCQD
jgi:hypothetical protein